jgi:carbonic anhydrase/acetyltransferase-like protein (isoleucine patch superfamily)
MGSPAKVVKALTAQQQVGLARSAEVYVAKFKQFKAELQQDDR